MPYLLGIDLGAGSLKAAVIDRAGRLVGEGACEIATLRPAPGFAEQDVGDWWRAMESAVRVAILDAIIEPSEIAGIGVTAGAHIPVLVDAAGEVIRPAILWSDQRAVGEAEALRARAGGMIERVGANRVNATWTLAMFAWLREHEPESVARVARVYFAKDYLRFLMTGTWETDFSDAVGALLADVKTGGWSPEICGLIGWDMSTLPPIMSAASVVGGVSEAAASALGLVAGTQVACGANDTTVELFGVGAVAAGDAAVKLATAGVLSLVTEGPSVNPPVSCYPHILPGMFYTATGTNSCASAHRWLRDLMFADGGFAEMDELAATVEAGAGGMLFHPYLQGERAPYWDASLRGDFIGLTMGHTRAHFARALYEGIAFSLCDVLRAAEALGLVYGRLRLMGGGARSATWRQIIADVTGLTVEVMENGDASFGAALVAGIGVGVFASPEDAVARCVRRVEVCEPDAGRHEVYARLFEIYKAGQRVLAPLGRELGGF
jgi:xylulokinase